MTRGRQSLHHAWISKTRRPFVVSIKQAKCFLLKFYEILLLYTQVITPFLDYLTYNRYVQGWNPRTPTFSKNGSLSSRSLNLSDSKSSTSQVASTYRPCRKAASGDASQTAKSPPSSARHQCQSRVRLRFKSYQYNLRVSHGTAAGSGNISLVASVWMSPGW